MPHQSPSHIRIRHAKRAAEAQAIEGVRFIAGDVLRALAELPAEERFDLVVLDPPRSGAREILPELVRRRPVSIACMSIMAAMI